MRYLSSQTIVIVIIWYKTFKALILGYAIATSMTSFLNSEYSNISILNRDNFSNWKRKCSFNIRVHGFKLGTPGGWTTYTHIIKFTGG